MASSQSTVARTTFPLPFEMTIEILLRLPVETLLRCKSVCKTWYDLIETPYFISKHLQTQVTIHPTSLLETTLNPVTNDHEISLICNNGFNNGRVKIAFPFMDRRNNRAPWEYDWPSYLSIVGICNGLVCIDVGCFRYPLILCNPSTRHFREIPNSIWPWDEFEDVRLSFGFGFHPSVNDYKLIRIMPCSVIQNIDNIRVDLYAMSTDTWTEIDFDKLSLFMYDNFVQICGSSASAVLNGVFYWSARVVPTNQVVVMCFDMGDEVFRKIRTPECLDRTLDVADWQFVELYDKLALVVSPDGRGFDVWVLNENESSWTNQVKAGSFPGIASIEGNGEDWEDGVTTVMGGGKNGELLVIEHKLSGDLKLFSYDTKTQDTMYLYFGQVSYEYSDVYLYAGTLLPVMQANEILLKK